jgi:aminopeptidase N
MTVSSLLFAGLLAACAASETGSTGATAADSDPLPQGATTTQPVVSSPVGVGDPVAPWAGNPGYDVTRYDWRLAVDPSSGILSGTTLLTATAVDALDTISVDYSGPAPVSVSVAGKEVEFDYISPKLNVPADLEAGETFTLEAVLNGAPDAGTSGTGWIHQGDLVYTAALFPGDTASWVPLNDTPTDPAVFSVTIDAGAGAAVISGTPMPANGETTWETPVAVSEVGMAVGAFEKRDVTSVSQPEVAVWTMQGQIPPSEQAIDDVVGDMLSYHESFLGPFPFQTLGLTKIQGFPGANSTPGQIFLGVFDQLTVAHELVHQWIGGSVGTASSRDAWLREGIPEYLAILWLTSQEEESFLQERLRSMYEQIAPSTRAPRDVTHRDDRSDNAVFVRGPLAIHALHVAMGDQAFRAGLVQLTSEYEGRSVSTQEFIDVMQSQSDLDIATVIYPWIDEEELPPFP